MARGFVRGTDLAQKRFLGLATVALARAASEETAHARVRVDRAARIAREHGAFFRPSADRRYRTHQGLRVGVSWMAKQAIGWAALHDAAEIHDHYPIAEHAHDIQIVR